jgi:hypothetical protein
MVSASPDETQRRKPKNLPFYAARKQPQGGAAGREKNYAVKRSAP